MILDVNKKVLLESIDFLEETGPWDMQRRAVIQHNVNIDQGLSDQYDTNKGHYFLNPLVGGPLTHGAVKIGNVINKGVYNVIKDSDSPEAPTKANVRANFQDNPWNAVHDVAGASLNNFKEDIQKSRELHPIQTLVNPLVGGPITQAVVQMAGANTENARIAFSGPKNTYGSTLIKK
jgi:hypothetical protein